MWSFDKLKAKLEPISNLEYNFKDIYSKRLTEAGILVPIIITNGVPFTLLTVRSMNLSNHPGQVSFPGGKRDPEDTDIVATALRETEEEIGMRSEHLKIIGTLLPYVTKSNFIVTAVVAEVLNYEAFSPKINPFEVSEILTVPLDIFILTKYHRCKTFSCGEKEQKLEFFEFVESDSVHIIWGLTALIATHVASLLFEKSPEFEYPECLAKRNKKSYNNNNKLIKSNL